MNRIYDFDLLDFNKINDVNLGKFIKLSDLLCNDGMIRLGGLKKRKYSLSQVDLMEYIDCTSNTTFRYFIQNLEQLNLIKKVPSTKGKFNIYINPLYCRNMNYIKNTFCEGLFLVDEIVYEKEYFVYRFLNKDNNVIYVGRTTDIKTRITTHLSTGHLPNECYNSIERIEFIKLETFADMSIYEIYYINKYNPMYNIKDKDEFNKGVSINLEEKKWEIYEQQ